MLWVVYNDEASMAGNVQGTPGRENGRGYHGKASCTRQSSMTMTSDSAPGVAVPRFVRRRVTRAAASAASVGSAPRFRFAALRADAPSLSESSMTIVSGWDVPEIGRAHV